MSHAEIPPGSVLGVLGDGQLGRMLGEAALPRGFKILTTGPGGRDSSTGYLSRHAWKWQPDWLKTEDDKIKAILNQIARRAHVVTTEWENVPAWMVEYLLAKGVVCAPGPKLLRTAQDRRLEKECFEALGLRTAPYILIESEGDDHVADAKNFIYPARLKTRGGGYDGKGQRYVARYEDLAQAIAGLKAGGANGPYILEAQINFAYETSVVCARNRRGDFVFYPAVINVHENGILRKTSYYEGLVPRTVEIKAQAAADKVAHHLEAEGVMTLEQFVTEDGEVIMNEIAPRVHNSGHWTQDGCDISQFDLHLAAICNWRLKQPNVICEAADMINVLTAGELREAIELAERPGTFLHLYDKKPPETGQRKVAHYNMITR